MWVRVDDGVPQHPKFLQAGREAAWFWVCGNCYCNKYLTDGFIAEHALISLSPGAPHRKLSALLVASNLWEKVAGGYKVHDYHDHNPRSEQVKSKREQDRLRKRLQAEDSTETPAPSVPVVTPRPIALPSEFPDGIRAESTRNSTGIQADSGRNPSGVALESTALTGGRAIASAPAIPSHPIPSPPGPVSEFPFRLGTNGSSRDVPPDEAWELFKAAYPPKRRSGGFMANQRFLAACASVGFAKLMDSLDKHKKSEDWRKGMVPALENWFEREFWIQEPDDPEQVSNDIAVKHLAELDRRRAESGHGLKR